MPSSSRTPARIREPTSSPPSWSGCSERSPAPYLHYYYFPSEVLEHQRTHPSRAEEVMEIEAGLLELYRDPSLDVKPKLLEERGGAFYSEAAAALVASLHAGTGDVQVVNVRNAGAIPNLPDDDVVEIPARVDRDGAHPVSTEPLAPEMLGMVQHAKAYERLTIAAAVVRTEDACAQGAAWRIRWSVTSRPPSRSWMRCSRRTARSSPDSSPRMSEASPAAGQMTLDPPRDVRVDLTTKGFPAVDRPISLSEVAEAGMDARGSAAPGPRPARARAHAQHRPDGRVLPGPRRRAGAAREDDDGAAALAAPARGGCVGHHRGDGRTRSGDGRCRRAACADRQRGDRPGGDRVDRSATPRHRCGDPAVPSIHLPGWSSSPRASDRFLGLCRSSSSWAIRAGAPAAAASRRRSRSPAS